MITEYVGTVKPPDGDTVSMPNYAGVVYQLHTQVIRYNPLWDSQVVKHTCMYS